MRRIAPGPFDLGVCRGFRRLLPALIVPLLVRAASPVIAQRPGDEGRRMVASLEVRPHLHRFETGWGLGARAGVEGPKWSFGLAAGRLLNDVDSAPLSPQTLGPETPIVQGEHFQGARLYGLYGSRRVHGRTTSRLTIDLLLGAVSFTRQTEALEFWAHAPDGTPLFVGVITTGLEVNGFVEPSVRYERDLGRGLRAHAGAGYQWSTRSWSGYASFNALTLSAGVAACMTCSRARRLIGLPAFLLGVVGGMLIDTSDPHVSGTLQSPDGP